MLPVLSTNLGNNYALHTLVHVCTNSVEQAVLSETLALNSYRCSHAYNVMRVN